ncbi:MAG TPA: amidohydrolase family protein [Candidatus Acidoferrales bacterium]
MNRMPTLILLWSFLGCLLLSAGSAAQEQHVTIIVNANVIDGVSAEPIRGVHVVIRDGRIEKIAPGKVEAPAGATVVDLQGKWLLPGFIDGHVHIANRGAAHLALRSGVTTARSMGVAHFADVGLRELHRGGIHELPDFIAAGYHVRPNLAEQIFLDRPDLRDLMGELRGEDNIRRVVRAMLERKVDVIKILATERAGLPDTDPRKPVFTESELAAAVDEARKGGITVAAHAHGDEGAAAAVRAGVKTIEHGTYMSEATLRLMAQRGTCLDPTIATVADLVEPGGDYDNALLAIRGRSMLPRVRETTRNALKLGVTVVAGTDTGYGASSSRRMGHEIIELMELGMPPMEAIKSGTSTAAACYGIAGRTGSIQAGLEADLIVVDRDPRAYPEALLDILAVFNNGALVVNRLKF